MEKVKIFPIVVMLVPFLLVSAGCYGLPQYEQSKKLAQKQEQRNMRQQVDAVRFYAIDQVRRARGAYLGYARIKDGKIEVAVTDKSLEQILKNPFKTMTGGVRNGVIYDSMVSYQPGSPEHLRAFATESHRHGFASEVVAYDAVASKP